MYHRELSKKQRRQNTYKMNPAYKSKKRRRAELRHHPEFREYAENMRQYIVTTRFNSDTWRENEEYRKQHPSFGSIYGTPELVNSNYKEKSVLFVLEMNNSENRIMGIGMVANIPHVKKYRIYSDDNYNRYAYMGKYRIDRENVQEKDEFIFELFDQLCFFGSGHQKKLPGIKGFPLDRLFKMKQKKEIDLVDYIKDMFKAIIIK
jgi:hypothetical protein